MTGIKDHPMEKEKTLTTNCDKDNIKPLKEKTLRDKQRDIVTKAVDDYVKIPIPKLKEKTLSEKGIFIGGELIYHGEDIKQFLKRLKERIKSKLRKLGVRIKDTDKFDLIGVENAIYSSIGEIDKEFGDKLT